MTSIIINSFYRALCSINDYTPIKDMDMKKLAVTLVDALYPEDGYVTLEDDPRGNFRMHLNDQFMDRMRAEVAKGLTVAEAIETTGLKEEKQEATVPISVPEVKEVKAPKPKAAPKPKLTPEEEAAAKAEKEAKAAADKAEKEAKAAADKAEKEAKAAADKAAKEAKAAADKAAKEAQKAAEKAAKEEAKKAPKPKFVGNIEKLNPTQDKAWKKIAADAKVELTDDHKKRFIAAVNALDHTVYNQKKLEVHMAEFFAPKEQEFKEEVMFPVDFNGKEYFVNKEGVVHETIKQEDGSDIDKKIGHVGMAEFADMKMPDASDFE
jgi:hypothetical protein